MTEKSIAETVQGSAYQLICEAFKQDPQTPYVFQDARTAGQASTLHYFFNQTHTAYERDAIARSFADVLVRLSIEDEDIFEQLQAVCTIPLSGFAGQLLDRLRLMLRTGLLNENALHMLGMGLAKGGMTVLEAAVGILVLGLFENDITHSMLRTFGLHSEFTIYVLIAIKYWDRFGSFVFDLAKNTMGYGKFAAISVLTPITPEQAEWMFQNAAQNCVAQNASAWTCLTNPDVLHYLDSTSVTPENYKYYSRNLAYALEETPFYESSLREEFVLDYLAHQTRCAHEFIDYAAAASIQRSVPFGAQPDGSRDREIWSACEKIVRHKKWLPVLLAQLAAPTESSSLIILALQTFERSSLHKPLDLCMEDFYPLLDPDPFDMSVMEYVLLDPDAAARFWPEIFPVLSDTMPGFVFEDGPQVYHDDELSPHFKPDVWLVYLLKAMARAQAEEEDFYMRCMGARYQDVRKEAVSALRAIKPKWSGLVQPFLEKVLETDPDENVKKRIRRLLGMSSQGQKEQQYVDIAECTVKPGPFDQSILNTTIAGAFYRDMSVVEGQLAFGDILFLKPQPENQYDANAILVTADDGYVLGYIPRTENEPLIARIQNGEKLYAILRDDIEYYGGRPFIEVFVSRQPKQRDNIITLPF